MLYFITSAIGLALLLVSCSSETSKIKVKSRELQVENLSSEEKSTLDLIETEWHKGSQYVCEEEMKALQSAGLEPSLENLVSVWTNERKGEQFKAIKSLQLGGSDKLVHVSKDKNKAYIRPKDNFMLIYEEKDSEIIATLYSKDGWSNSDS